MFLINPVFSLIAIISIFLIYFWLERRQLAPNSGDIRGGMFLSIAERAIKLAAKFPTNQSTWKPDLLIPVEDPKSWSGPLSFINNITYP
ncbi:MAG: Na-K-Cl cotransporter, partial [Candidatus Dadabacteria bacterium]|nr:Na-K-Cl cotransporter [Candidatus Dadabacteria bacterium]